ncbi:MAG: DedA family protein [Sulfurospirillum sp.]
MEAYLIELLQHYGYIILYFWSIFEGEMGLIMAGIMSHTGNMNLYIAIFVAGLGGFSGDQIYFHIGRYNKKFVYRKFRSQRRKFALAHVLIKNNGWPIIFLQRYMYGLRTIIPMSIGLTGYSAKKFAFINLLSAWVWATVTIMPAWYFGEEILVVIKWAKSHWYLAAPLGLAMGGGIYYYFHVTTEKKIKEKVRKKI